MTKHPTADWVWDDYAEEEFVKWFNGDYGSPYSLRIEYFFGDCEVKDENTLKDLMYKWLHTAFLEGYNMGRFHDTKVGLTNNE
jgi:hypothetical protein